MKNLKISLLCYFLLFLGFSCSSKMSHSQRKKESFCRLKLCSLHLKIECQIIDSPDAINIREIIKELKKKENDLFVDKKQKLIFIVNPNFSIWKNLEEYQNEETKTAICCKVDFYPPSRNVHYLAICFDGRTIKELREPPHWYIKATKKLPPPKKT